MRCLFIRSGTKLIHHYTNEHHCSMQQFGYLSPYKRHQQMISNGESRQKRDKEQRNTTLTLLAVCFAFLILHTPLAVYNCMAMTAITFCDNQVRVNWYFINYFGLTMAEVQNSINFYSYFLIERRYRQLTFSLLVSCKFQNAKKMFKNQNVLRI